MGLLSLENLQKKTGRSFYVRMLIEDKNYAWVDFSEYLVSYPNIKSSISSRFLGSQYTSSISSLKLKNDSRFWDKPLPSDLKTIDGAAAEFNSTKNSSYSVLVNRQVQFRLVEKQDEQKYREKALGTFLIDDISTDLTEFATMKIAGLEKQLQEKDASEVKNGQSWYQNRTISFLVKKLLEPIFGDRNNSQIPTSFSVPAFINQSTYDDSKTLSTIGQPPQFTDTTGDGVGNIYYERNLKTRAIEIAPSTIAYGSKQADRDTLYLGCNENLYRYNTTDDIYEQLATCATGYYIKKIFYTETLTPELLIIAYKNFDNTLAVPVIASDVIIYSYTEDGLVQNFSSENFLDGKYYGRNGVEVTNGAAIGNWGSESGYNYGPPILANYSQYLFTLDLTEGSTADYLWARYNPIDTSDTDSIDADFIAGNTLPGNISGYNSALCYSDNDTPSGIFEALNAALSGDFGITLTAFPALGARLSFGQQGIVCYNPTKFIGFEKGCILYAERDPAIISRTQCNLKLYNVNTRIATTIEEDFTVYTSVNGIDEFASWPTCAASITGSARFFIGATSFYEEDSGDPTHVLWDDYSAVVSKIYSYDFYNDELTVIAEFILGSGEGGFVPLEIYHHQPTGSTYVVFLDYLFCEEETTTAQYFIRKYDQNFVKVKDFYHTFVQPKSLVIHDNKLWFVTQSSGYFGYIDIKDSSYPFYTEDNGFPIVDNNYYLQTNLIIDEYTRDNETLFWGIASSVFDEQQVQTSEFGSYLFKHDTKISEHLDLADFSGLSCWDALGLLAQRAYCLMGFDEIGNFFFNKREADTTASYTITDQEITSCEKDSGRDNIANNVELTPYILEYTQPEYTASIKERLKTEENETAGEDAIELKQLDTLSKKIVLICVRDGDANTGASSLTGFPLFKYGIFEPVITTRVVESVVNLDSFEVSSVFGGEDTEYGIKAGYYLIYTTDDEDETYIRVTDVDSSTNIITVESPVSVSVNSELKIIRKSELGTASSFWSDEGVTFLTSYADSATQTVNSVDALSVGLVVKIGKHTSRIASIDATATPYPTITLENSIETSSAQVVGEDNRTVRAYFAPRYYTTFYEIGNTNVYMKVNMGAAGVRAIFKQGDKFTINCEGFSLTSDDNSKQVAVNSQSIAKYGIQQFKTINNRFFTRKIAQLFARLIRTNWAWPKHTFKVTIPLSNYLEFLGSSQLTRVTLRSERLLPYRPGYSEDCYITSISHNTSQGTTSLELQAIEPY